jgi:formiminotetrahydrofolate cyclodeaminase
MSYSPPPLPPIDWAALVAELEAQAGKALGNRAQKITDVLAAADRSYAGIDAAIDQIRRMRIFLVDRERLEQLAHKMKERLTTRAGPAPG